MRSVATIDDSTTRSHPPADPPPTFAIGSSGHQRRSAVNIIETVVAVFATTLLARFDVGAILSGFGG